MRDEASCCWGGKGPQRYHQALHNAAGG